MDTVISTNGNVNISEFAHISVITYQWLLVAQLGEIFRLFSQRYERYLLGGAF